MQDKNLDEIINRILQVIVPDKIVLFGSRARGEAGPDSDYDLLVIKAGIESERKIAQKIHVNLVGINESVDIIVATPQTIERNKNRFVSIINNAFLEGITVYG